MRVFFLFWHERGQNLGGRFHCHSDRIGSSAALVGWHQCKHAEVAAGAFQIAWSHHGDQVGHPTQIHGFAPTDDVEAVDIHRWRYVEVYGVRHYESFKPLLRVITITIVAADFGTLVAAMLAQLDFDPDLFQRFE